MKKEGIKIIGLITLLFLCILLIAYVEEVIGFLEGISSKECINNMSMYLFGLMIFSMVVYIIYAFIRMIRYEKKSSKLRNVLKIGNSVEINSPTSYRLSGTVSSIEDEYVTVTIKVRKSLIYPINND